MKNLKTMMMCKRSIPIWHKGQGMKKIFLASILCFAFVNADAILDGEWIRVGGGSAKIMTIKDNEGNFNTKWMNTYAYIRSIKQTNLTHWSCEMIHNKGSKLFWEPCEIDKEGDKLIIKDKYTEHVFAREIPITNH